ncbi:MAG: right-handed parallel beta-helix repeat-containing protein, partial [Planctomycetota bacterium]
IVGYSGGPDSMGGYTATLYDPTGNGNNIALGVVGNSYANSINNDGLIVGREGVHATLFDITGSGNNINLNDLIDPSLGWSLSSAIHINDNGWIIGQGINPAGDRHAFLMMTPVQPAIYYVDGDAAGANDGSSWADAFNYLQDALAVGLYGDEIRVAQGIYKPDQGGGNTLGDRTATFQLKNGVAIKGGYAGLGEADPNARDIELCETILSGDLDGNDIDVNDPADLLDEPTRTENSLTVVTGSGTDASAILEGFVIRGGHYDILVWGSPSIGAGMHNTSGSPTMVECTFKSNATIGGAGGGMRNRRSSSPRVVRCTFSGNSQRGMHNTEDSNPIVIDCTFSGNSGGGMSNHYSSPTVTVCKFIANSGYAGGGISNHHSSPVLTNCLFASNRANYSSDRRLSGNGGGMWNTAFSTPVLINCSFVGNSAEDDGGGISNYGFISATLTNCMFIGNSAENSGGGMYNHYVNNPILLTGCTFAGNSGTNGSALACDSDEQNYPSSVHITNCIFWNGGDEIWNNDNSVITITYSDVQGDWLGEGNIDADPCFVERGYWDANGVWIEGDYHLLEDSPCIDAGDPNYVAGPNETDLDGKSRVIRGRIDMGAYEYCPPLPAEVRIVPRTINLTSKGKWITSLFWLPKEYDVADIDPNSVLLEGEIQAELFRVDEEEQVAVARFSRSEVQGILNVGQVELIISGRLTDGTIFEGTDTIRVIDKGKKK